LPHLSELSTFIRILCMSMPYYETRSLGALRAPTSRLRPFGPALGPSGLLDNVLHALRALRPCDPRNSAISPKIRNFPENPKFPRKSEISHPNTILMMMMTIWWSKATWLLEFSRSLAGTCAPEKRDTFCVTGRRTGGQAGGGIGYSSSWMRGWLLTHLTES